MQSEIANFEVKMIGLLKGHNDWVTSIIVSPDHTSNKDLIISGSRDRTILLWTEFENPVDDLAGQPKKQLQGHSHFISDLAISLDNKYLISSSWDHELRLWDLQTGFCTNRFVGHQKEVFTIAFSPDCRQIISAGAEKNLKLFNTKGECKFTSEKNNHVDWVSRVRFSPIKKDGAIQPYFASVGWDGWLKIWNHNYTLRFAFRAHDGNIQALDISPLVGNLVATGGKDKKLYIWDITDLKKPKHEYDAGSSINCVAFHTQQHWVAAATQNGIKIWVMSNEAKDKQPFYHFDRVVEINGVKKSQKFYGCTSLAFNAEGDKLYGGFTDGQIAVLEIVKSND